LSKWCPALGWRFRSLENKIGMFYVIRVRRDSKWAWKGREEHRRLSQPSIAAYASQASTGRRTVKETVRV